jgi:UPF0716 protein FxsA
MFYRLLLLFTIVPFVELIVLIEVGKQIGTMTTLMIIILTGILGASLARVQGFLVLSRIRDDLSMGKIPTDALLDGLLILIGAVVLLTPGFITDIIGFLLLIPVTRAALREPLRNYFRNKIQTTSQFYSSPNQIFEDDQLD